MPPLCCWLGCPDWLLLELLLLLEDEEEFWELCWLLLWDC